MGSALGNAWRSGTRRRSATGVAAGFIGVVLAASTVAAAGPSWSSPVAIRTVEGAELQDADFAQQLVGAGWQEPGPNGRPSVRLRLSWNAGQTFGPAAVKLDSRQAAVDWCRVSPPDEGEFEAVYARRLGPGNWVIEHAMDIGAWPLTMTQLVAPSDGIQRWPDIACADGRIFISWFEREGSGDRLMLAHKMRPDGSSDWENLQFTIVDLGVDKETFFGRSLAVAGTFRSAYVVFSRSDGDLRFKRWLIPHEYAFPAAQPTQVIANGTPENSASEAVIAAQGTKVAVAWFKCGGIFARVSNDRGLTWGPTRKVLEHQACFGDFGATPRSINISGNRIAITYLAAGIPDVSFVGLIRTNNDFATFRDDQITQSGHDEHLVGYLRIDGATKLAAAFDRGDRIRFRLQE